MLPLNVLKCAVGHPVLVEVKSGETFNGNLANVDNYMNIQLRDCICTSREGDRFWRMVETFIRGNSIKFLRVPDELANIAKAEMERQSQESGRFRADASQRGSHGMRGGIGGGGRGRGNQPVRG